VDLCGEGEWYVGSRGGAGDHAAMKFGRRSQVSRIRFFPFAFEYTPGIPDDYRLVVFNSLIEAKKSAGARDIFNQKVAAYEFALMLIVDRYPHHAHLIEHLRDVNAERLHVRPHVIYEMLASLPPTMTREQLRQGLSAAHRDKAERIFQTHSEPTAYDIRSVMLYGLAECARSERCGELLKTGRLDEFGRMMCVSHDGDRVARRDASGTMAPHDYSISDEALREGVEGKGVGALGRRPFAKEHAAADMVDQGRGGGCPKQRQAARCALGQRTGKLPVAAAHQGQPRRLRLCAVGLRPEGDLDVPSESGQAAVDDAVRPVEASGESVEAGLAGGLGARGRGGCEADGRPEDQPPMSHRPGTPSCFGAVTGSTVRCPRSADTR